MPELPTIRVLDHLAEVVHVELFRRAVRPHRRGHTHEHAEIREQGPETQKHGTGAACAKTKPRSPKRSATEDREGKGISIKHCTVLVPVHRPPQSISYVALNVCVL